MRSIIGMELEAAVVATVIEENARRAGRLLPLSQDEGTHLREAVEPAIRGTLRLIEWDRQIEAQGARTA